MYNPHPITEVTEADKGRKVSYLCPGMKEPDTGVITGTAYVPEMAFVSLNGERATLTSIYNLQWGHVAPWVMTKDGTEI